MKTMTVAVLCACLVGCAKKPDANEQDPLGGPEMRKSASGAADLGWQYFNKGDYETAMRRFQMAVRHDPAYAPGYYGIAYVYSVQGRLDEAIKYYRLTLERDQKYPYAFANLGYALLQKEQFEEGLHMLDKALKLKPDCGEAYVSYANYYAYKGQWRNAQEAANKAIGYGQVIHSELRKLLEDKGVKLIEGPKNSEQGGGGVRR